MSGLATDVAVSRERLLPSSSRLLPLLLPSKRLRPFFLSGDEGLVERQRHLLDFGEVRDVVSTGGEDIPEPGRQARAVAFAFVLVAEAGPRCSCIELRRVLLDSANLAIRLAKLDKFGDGSLLVVSRAEVILEGRAECAIVCPRASSCWLQWASGRHNGLCQAL